MNQQTDYRALCVELTDCLEKADWPPCYRHVFEQWIHITRKALAEPMVDGPAVPEGREPASVVWEPSDEELLELMPETMRDEFSYAAKACSNATGGQVKSGIFRVCLNSAALEYARAALARYGHQPAPPAEGEVGELAVFLRGCAEDHYGQGRRQFTRAADLLERQVAPVPVAVSERLPGPEDCDADGRCWVHQPHEACPESPAWELMLAKYASANYGAVCWLPAKALPLPQGEVE